MGVEPLRTLMVGAGVFFLGGGVCVRALVAWSLCTRGQLCLDEPCITALCSHFVQDMASN